MLNLVELAQKSASRIFGTVHGPFKPKVICAHGEGIYFFDQDGKKDAVAWNTDGR